MAGGGFFLLSDSLSGALDLLGTGDMGLDEAESIGQELLADAKSNAPWADRTGAAREGLEVEVSKEGGDIVITLGHSVEYGIWLELIQSGRFAIIMPTLEKYAAEIHRAVAEGVLSGG
jgi:hypothetical protein